MQSWAQAPHLGAQPPIAIPADAVPIRTSRIGYIAHIDVAGLARLAERHDLTIHVAELAGAFVHPERSLAHVEGSITDAIRQAIDDAFAILPDRDFEQDPRFGLIVLSEIASRALSPAVNDPGTAIRVLGAGHRVLADFADIEPGAKAACHSRVYAPLLEVADLFDDFFRPIARDGAALIEVQLRLQATLAGLAAHAPICSERSRDGTPTQRSRAPTKR